ALGLLNDRFALCQTLPLDQFAGVAEELGRCGYRPTRLRPYRTGNVVQAAVVWVRDGRRCQWALGVPAAKALEQDGEWRQKGFVPADAAGYVNGDGTEAYAVLWEA